MIRIYSSEKYLISGGIQKLEVYDPKQRYEVHQLNEASLDFTELCCDLSGVVSLEGIKEWDYEGLGNTRGDCGKNLS